jgi:hypothetical protein
MGVLLLRCRRPALQAPQQLSTTPFCPDHGFSSTARAAIPAPPSWATSSPSRSLFLQPPWLAWPILTLDAPPVPGKREDDERSKDIVKDRESDIKDADGAKLKGGGGIGQSLFFGTDPTLTWKKTLPWLAKHTKKPIILKGLQTHEDAYLAAQHVPQVQGIILSNHGGRAADTAPPAVHTLLEIRKYCPEVFGNCRRRRY